MRALSGSTQSQYLACRPRTSGTIIAELGMEISRFPTVKQFCAWLSLAPRNAISGGNVLRSHQYAHPGSTAGQARGAAHAVETRTLAG